jgi:hypothetical protein
MVPAPCDRRTDYLRRPAGCCAFLKEADVIVGRVACAAGVAIVVRRI